MIYTNRLTQKGQVTIPQEIRNFLGIKPRQFVTFIKYKNQVIITPKKNISSLMGSLKTRKKYSDEKADKSIMEYIKKEYAKEISSRR